MAKRSRRIGDLSIALITFAWIIGAAGAGYLVTHSDPAPPELTAATATPAPIVPVHQAAHHHSHRLSVPRRAAAAPSVET